MELFLVVAVDEINVNVISHPPEGRAIPRSNCNNQRPHAERPKCATTRVLEPTPIIERKETRHENERPKEIANDDCRCTSRGGFYRKTAFSSTGKTC